MGHRILTLVGGCGRPEVLPEGTGRHERASRRPRSINPWERHPHASLAPPRAEARVAACLPTQPERHAQLAPHAAHGQGTSPPRSRCSPTFAGAATTTPPARAHERDAARRTSWSSSRSRSRCRSARSRPSGCLPDPPSAPSDAAASPLSAAARARAGRHLQSEHRPRCAEPMTASGGNRTRDRPSRRAPSRQVTGHRRRREPPREERRRCRPPQPHRLSTAAGTEGGARS